MDETRDGSAIQTATESYSESNAEKTRGKKGLDAGKLCRRNGGLQTWQGDASIRASRGHRARAQRSGRRKLTRESPDAWEQERRWRGSDPRTHARRAREEAYERPLIRIAIALALRARGPDPRRGVREHLLVLGVVDPVEADRALLPAAEEQLQLGQVGNVAEVPKRDLSERPAFNADAIARHDVLHVRLAAPRHGRVPVIGDRACTLDAKGQQSASNASGAASSEYGGGEGGAGTCIADL